MFECAIKLNLKPLTSSTAAIIFHKFYREVDINYYDEYLMVSSSIYLAGKIKDEPIKTRDIINVAHCTLNRGSSPLELGDEYWSMRDAIIQGELLLTRMLKFELNIEHPHKYMIHYMKSLKDWFGESNWNSMPIAKVAFSFLQDFHHSPAILNYKPSHIAICCLSLALQTYGIQVPLTDETEELSTWYHVFVNDLSKEKLWEIIECIIDVYNTEAEIDKNLVNRKQ